MSKYRVSLCFMSWDDYIIEADNKDEAMEKARAAYEAGHGAQGEGEAHRTPEYDEVHWEA